MFVQRLDKKTRNFFLKKEKQYLHVISLKSGFNIPF
jgi:hypothetical protein